VDIIERDICPDLAKTAKNLVMGDGNVDAEIVIIGEAPGKNEDEQGLPFVGAAGKFLDEMLSNVELSRSDIYITNIVKYRPPNNRDPTPEEKKAFWPYLVRQLDVIQPKIVVTLGRHSMEYFLPEQKISAIHGQLQRIQFEESTIVIVPLYHPAAALYNGSLRATLIEDFNKLTKIIEILEKEKENK
jgi:uracil-DNA glycosylase family 4